MLDYVSMSPRSMWVGLHKAMKSIWGACLIGSQQCNCTAIVYPWNTHVQRYTHIEYVKIYVCVGRLIIDRQTDRQTDRRRKSIV